MAIQTQDVEQLSRFQVYQSRLQASQFILSLHPSTLVPLDIASPFLGKTVATVRTNLSREPEILPPVVRRNGRVFMRVSDLMAWADGTATAAPTAPAPTGKKRGRPTKAQQAARARLCEDEEGGAK
jgi:hypothetical protein